MSPHWHETDLVMISALQHWSYCARQCGLIHLEQTFDENLYTLRGRIVHEQADLPGAEKRKGVRVERALPLFCDRLGLVGKADVVEFHTLVVPPSGGAGRESERPTEPAEAGTTNGAAAPSPPAPLPQGGEESGGAGRGEGECVWVPFPVEYKHGSRKDSAHDDLQLCAQALCLEEMTGQAVPRGAIYHHGSRRRREVEFTAALRRRVEETVAAIREMLRVQRLPEAPNDKRCDKCSLLQSCLPSVVAESRRVRRVVASLFRVE